MRARSPSIIRNHLLERQRASTSDASSSFSSTLLNAANFCQSRERQRSPDGRPGSGAKP